MPVPERCERCGAKAPLSKLDAVDMWLCSKCYKELVKKCYQC